MLVKPQTSGPAKLVTFKKRQQKRHPRRMIESVPQDWVRWDEAAKAEGVNFSEFTRRALHVRAREILGIGRAGR